MIYVPTRYGNFCKSVYFSSINDKNLACSKQFMFLIQAIEWKNEFINIMIKWYQSLWSPNVNWWSPPFQYNCISFNLVDLRYSVDICVQFQYLNVSVPNPSFLIDFVRVRNYCNSTSFLGMDGHMYHRT